MGTKKKVGMPKKKNLGIKTKKFWVNQKKKNFLRLHPKKNFFPKFF